MFQNALEAYGTKVVGVSTPFVKLSKAPVPDVDAGAWPAGVGVDRGIVGERPDGAAVGATDPGPDGRTFVPGTVAAPSTAGLDPAPPPPHDESANAVASRAKLIRRELGMPRVSAVLLYLNRVGKRTIC
jgi:hypothetical protein